MTDVVVAAAGRSLASNPGFVRGVCRGATGVGVVVETGERVLVPVVRNACEAPLPQVRAEVARLVESALRGALSPGDLGGAAITVHDLLPGGSARPDGASGACVLTVGHRSCDSPELTLTLAVGGSADPAEAERFFTTLVRLLQLPYRRLV